MAAGRLQGEEQEGRERAACRQRVTRSAPLPLQAPEPELGEQYEVVCDSTYSEAESAAAEVLDLPLPSYFRSRSHSYLRAIQAGCSQEEDTGSIGSISPPPAGSLSGSRTLPTNSSECQRRAVGRQRGRGMGPAWTGVTAADRLGGVEHVRCLAQIPVSPATVVQAFCGLMGACSVLEREASSRVMPLGWLGLDVRMQAPKWQTGSGCRDLASTSDAACKDLGELEVFTQSSQTQA